MKAPRPADATLAHRESHVKFIGLLTACLICAGCGSGGPFDYVPVSGSVKYDDGTTIPDGCRLIFTAQGVDPVGTAHPRPAMANVDANGNFDCVTSYKYCDGLIPGQHKVVIQAASERATTPIVPKEYTSVQTTPLIVDTADAPFEIKVPKPKPGR
jgi:hypothetical protein